MTTEREIIDEATRTMAAMNTALRTRTAERDALRVTVADLVEALAEANAYAIAVNMAAVKHEPIPLLYGDVQWGDGHELPRWEGTLARARGIGQHIDKESQS